MPQNRLVEYIFMNNVTSVINRLFAYELGHGIYNLYHTFEEVYGMAQGCTNNLMDYAFGNSNFLVYYQWKLIDQLGFAWSLFASDEDSMVKNHKIKFEIKEIVYESDKTYTAYIKENNVRIKLLPLDSSFIFPPAVMLQSVSLPYTVRCSILWISRLTN